MAPARAAPSFPDSYRIVAMGPNEAPAGLVRIRAGRPPSRLGLIGVLREHRRRGLASALLAAAFSAVPHIAATDRRSAGGRRRRTTATTSTMSARAKAIRLRRMSQRPASFSRSAASASSEASVPLLSVASEL
jgi:GNAT superfamily N-acetyltransferase